MSGPYEPTPTSDDRLTRFSQFIGRVIPDAMSTAIGMLLLLALWALAIGNSGSAILDAFYRGLWMLLPFTMQMTLILLLSSALGAAPMFKRAVGLLSRLPRTRGQVIALGCLLVAGFGYLFWGLAFALGPLVSIYFAREAEGKGIKVDFPFLLATTFAAGAVWQLGLSSSAPLLMNTPGHFLEEQTGLMPLSTTIWATPTLVFVASFVVAVIVAARLLHPTNPRQLSEFPDTLKLTEPLAVTVEAEPVGRTSAVPTLSDRVERSSVPVMILVAALAAWLYHHFAVKGLGLDLTSLNTFLFGLALLVHRNVAHFNRALRAGILSCWPIVVMYHVYGGVAGLLQHTTLGATISGGLASVSTRQTFVILTALLSAVLSCFVPSSGGQWVIQGYVTAAAATSVGVSVQQALLAMSVGDQMGNFLTPFWVAVSAGVARIDFRRFIGYLFVYAVIWFVLGVLVFTLIPA